MVRKLYPRRPVEKVEVPAAGNSIGNRRVRGANTLTVKNIIESLEN